MASGRTTIVIATRDRREELLRTLTKLAVLPEEPPVIVVDNASSDGSAEAVRRRFPHVEVVVLPENRGATARNVGAAAATTPYVAFCDDDSWFLPGSLDRAEALLEGHDRLAVVAARILVGDEERVDPTSHLMADSPLEQEPGIPGPAVLGFLACGAVVRRSAFLSVGGFSDVLFFVGEEGLLAIDLASAGWHLTYAADVVAVHCPASSTRDPRHRRRQQARNDLLATWMRRPLGVALRRTAGAALGAGRDPVLREALLGAAARLPAALRARQPVPAVVERRVRLLEAGV